jgi:hypothetical protein
MAEQKRKPEESRWPQICGTAARGYGADRGPRPRGASDDERDKRDKGKDPGFDRLAAAAEFLRAYRT